jgi:hypothetical protein
MTHSTFKTGDVFFKGLKEDTSMEGMVKKIVEVLEWEAPNMPGLPDLVTKVNAHRTMDAMQQRYCMPICTASRLQMQHFINV